jgi:glutathione peroxidase
VPGGDPGAGTYGRAGTDSGAGADRCVLPADGGARATGGGADGRSGTGAGPCADRRSGATSAADREAGAAPPSAVSRSGAAAAASRAHGRSGAGAAASRSHGRARPAAGPLIIGPVRRWSGWAGPTAVSPDSAWPTGRGRLVASQFNTHNQIVRHESSLRDLSYTSNTGEEVSLAGFAGRPVLIANTARQCGLAAQYAELQKLHEIYGPQGLAVIGFPCDQFAHQEPGTDEVIAQECQVNFGVSFPLSTKVEVNGGDTHPVFRFLKTRASSMFGSRIKWNFTKFLVSPDGVTVRRFAPTTKPQVLTPVIESLLAEARTGDGDDDARHETA